MLYSDASTEHKSCVNKTNMLNVMIILFYFIHGYVSHIGIIASIGYWPKCANLINEHLQNEF